MNKDDNVEKRTKVFKKIKHTPITYYNSYLEYPHQRKQNEVTGFFVFSQ